MIKAVFFDIDGTLVSFHTNAVPESAFQALAALQEKGIKVFVATGRGPDGLKVLKDFPFDGYITLNGQYCYVGDKVIYENTIPRADIQALLDYLEVHPFPCGFSEVHGKYFNMRDGRVDALHAITKNDNQPVADCSDVVNKKILQCMAFVDLEEEAELMKALPHCISARWHPSFCDISPTGGTKQNGIDQFLKYYDLDLSQTMAFGDGGNDIPMLKHVPVSVALGNANEEVKEIASYVTDDVDHDGVVHALAHFGLL